MQPSPEATWGLFRTDRGCTGRGYIAAAVCSTDSSEAHMSTTLVIIEHTDNHSHVQIVGPLDLAGVGMIELKFTASTASKRKHAIVDMSQVPFMASLGMGLLVQVARTLAGDGRKVVLLAPTDIVATALRTSRLDAVMPIAADLDAAHAHLKA